jgi:hypothetical protein
MQSLEDGTFGDLYDEIDEGRTKEGGRLFRVRRKEGADR